MISVSLVPSSNVTFMKPEFYRARLEICAIHELFASFISLERIFEEYSKSDMALILNIGSYACYG